MPATDPKVPPISTVIIQRQSAHARHRRPILARRLHGHVGGGFGVTGLAGRRALAVVAAYGSVDPGRLGLLGAQVGQVLGLLIDEGAFLGVAFVPGAREPPDDEDEGDEDDGAEGGDGDDDGVGDHGCCWWWWWW